MAGVKGIRDYERIRKYLRSIYVYGFFSREDFEAAGIGSAKDYDFGSRLIREVFPNLEDSELWNDKKKYLRFQRRYTASGENRLSDSYMLRSISENKELPELLWLLSDLSRRKAALGELSSLAETRSEDGESKYSMTRRRALELMEYGAVEKRGDEFCLRDDPLKGLTVRQLGQLWDYIRFSEGTTHPRAAAGFLRRTLERELMRRGEEASGETPFLLRHNVNSNVFDEELVHQLLAAVADRRRVLLDLQGREAQADCLPVELRIDVRLGRWYLVGMGERPVICRVSGIRGLTVGEQVSEAEWQEAAQRAQAAFAHSGCSGLLREEPVLVEAKLHFGRQVGLRNQFVRELRLGTVVEKEDGEYYQALVNDPVELVPLLRSFAPWVQVLPGDHDLDTRLREALEQMRRSLREEADHGTAE